MKAYVIEEYCFGCCNCEAICPDVFRVNEQGKAIVLVEIFNDSLREDAENAVAECPIDCIILDETEQDAKYDVQKIVNV